MVISKEIKFLLKHSSIYGLGTVTSQIVTFALLPLYTRYLTPSDYGILELLDISSSIIGLIITAGIVNALSRFYYESEVDIERNKVVSSTYIVYFVIACFFTPILLGLSDPIARILFSSEDYGYFFKISFLSLILGVLIDIGMMYLRLINKSVIFITITTTRLFLLITFNIIFIVYFNMGVLGILYSTLIVRVLYSLLITASILWKTKIYFNLTTARDLLKYGLPIIPSNIASTLVKYSDRYFILYFVSVADVGIYGLAMKLGVVVHNLLTIPFNMVYIPRRFEIMNRDNAGEIYSKIFTYYLFLVGYFGLALSVLIPEILQLMVTSKFLKAGQFVPLVIVAMIIFGSQYHFNFGILHSKKTQYLAYINILSALINLGLNFILISLYGLWGAVFSYFMVVGLQTFLIYMVSNKLYPIQFNFKRIVNYTLVALGIFIVSTQIKFDYFMMNLIIKLLLLILFPISLILLKIITPEEKSKVKEIFCNKFKPIMPYKI